MTSPGPGIAYPSAGIEAASRAAGAAGVQARGIDLGAAVDSIVAGLPGSASSAAGAELAASWRQGMRGLADDFTRHSDALAAASGAMGQTDQQGAASMNPAPTSVPVPGGR